MIGGALIANRRLPLRVPSTMTRLLPEITGVLQLTAAEIGSCTSIAPERSGTLVLRREFDQRIVADGIERSISESNELNVPVYQRASINKLCRAAIRHSPQATGRQMP